MLCSEGTRLAIALAEAKSGMSFSRPDGPNESVTSSANALELSQAERILASARMDYVEHKAMCSICLSEEGRPRDDR
jgi:hypothetical protein